MHFSRVLHLEVRRPHEAIRCARGRAVALPSQGRVQGGPWRLLLTGRMNNQIGCSHPVLSICRRSPSRQKVGKRKCAHHGSKVRPGHGVPQSETHSLVWSVCRREMPRGEGHCSEPPALPPPSVGEVLHLSGFISYNSKQRSQLSLLHCESHREDHKES